MEEPDNNSSTFEFNAALDTRYLAGIYSGDAANALYIFQLYLDELPGTVHDIKAAFIDNDPKALFEVVHKTKTSFSFVGLTYIAVLMEGLELRCAGEGSVQNLEKEIDSLLAEIEQSMPLIRSEFQKLKVHTKAN
jgi:HPt (histidine-containing phosphotransfer) domain-containing protein